MSQATGESDAKTLAYISSLEGKLDAMNSRLDATLNELNIIKNRPNPEPQVTVVTPPPSRSELIATSNPAADAIARIGVVNVYFDSGKSSIKSEFYNDLNRVVSLMLQYPETTVNLIGFTDKSGNPTTNLRLSQSRASSVADFLKMRGVDRSRIRTGSKGDSEAVQLKDPFSRRVEVRLNTY